jgi:hypothetical protein
MRCAKRLFPKSWARLHNISLCYPIKVAIAIVADIATTSAEDKHHNPTHRKRVGLKRARTTVTTATDASKLKVATVKRVTITSLNRAYV